MLHLKRFKFNHRLILFFISCRKNNSFTVNWNPAKARFENGTKKYSTIREEYNGTHVHVNLAWTEKPKFLSERLKYIIENQDTIKFICLNDDLDHKNETTSLIIDEIKTDFYEVLFPLCSRFEKCITQLPLSTNMYDSLEKFLRFVIIVCLVAKLGPRLLKNLLRNNSITILFHVSK